MLEDFYLIRRFLFVFLILLSFLKLKNGVVLRQQKRVNVLYWDRDVVVAEKPHNMLSVPGVSSEESMAGIIADMFQIQRVDQCIVHRLDYATSGLMIFARNVPALQNLHEQFRCSGLLKKSYIAIVDGIMDSYEGEIDLPLGRDSEKGNPFCRVDTINGKPSKTVWRMIDFSKCKSMVELTPITGRTHQLRLHMAATSHPIIGDLLYFPDKESVFAERLMLHASYLRFERPFTDEVLQFSSKLPLTL